MQPSNSDLDQVILLQEINDLVDPKLMQEIGDFLNAKPEMRTVVVAATLVALVADALGTCCSSHKEICTTSAAYGDYLHQFAHCAFDESQKQSKPH